MAADESLTGRPPLAMRVYQFLLHLFPPSFRARFGGDLTDVFADRLAAARRRGRIAILSFWLRTTAEASRWRSRSSCSR